MSQAKVQQLYKLDRLLQEESGTLHSLQQDKVGISIITVTRFEMFKLFEKFQVYFKEKKKCHTTNDLSSN
jgi:hypothetical protein